MAPVECERNPKRCRRVDGAVPDFAALNPGYSCCAIAARFLRNSRSLSDRLARRCPVGFVLLPIPERAEGNVEARREFLLSKAAGLAYNLHLGNTPSAVARTPDNAAASMAASLRKGPGWASTCSRPSGSRRTSFRSVFLRRTIIVSSFILSRLARRDDADRSVTFCKDNDHKAARHPADQNETVLVVFLALVLPNEGKGFSKARTTCSKHTPAFCSWQQLLSDPIQSDLP